MNPKISCLRSLSLAIAITSLPITPQAVASDLVYYPLNPSFGGNPMNGSVLLNSALATNKHTAPSLDDRSELEGGQQTPLQAFQESLERAVLSRLTSAATSNLFDPSTGKLVPGTVETSSFIITITDTGSGILAINTLDKTTGGSTTFEVTQ